MGFDKRFQAVTIRGHCRLMALGMTHSRFTKTTILELAGEITGVKYKRGQHDIAAEHLTAWIEKDKRA